jgi:hypothetical protein
MTSAATASLISIDARRRRREQVLHCFVQRWFAAATAQKIMYRLQWSKKAPD